VKLVAGRFFEMRCRAADADRSTSGISCARVLASVARACA